MRRFGDPPRKDTRYTDRPGVYGVLADGDHLLVTEERTIVTEIQLPGGGIDPGESPVRALHREVMEETGWRIRVHRRLGVYQRFTYMPDYDLWARKICHIYLCTPTRRISPPTEAHHRAIWMNPAEACRVLASPGDAHFVEDWARTGSPQ